LRITCLDRSRWRYHGTLIGIRSFLEAKKTLRYTHAYNHTLHARIHIHNIINTHTRTCVHVVHVHTLVHYEKQHSDGFDLTALCVSLHHNFPKNYRPTGSARFGQCKIHRQEIAKASAGWYGMMRYHTGTFPWSMWGVVFTAAASFFYRTITAFIFYSFPFTWQARMETGATHSVVSRPIVGSDESCDRAVK